MTFDSSQIADLVIAVTLVEAIGLIAYRQATGRGLPVAALLGMLAPGLCLMEALRLALTGGGWQSTALCLLLAGVAHLDDLRRRWAMQSR